MRVELAVGDFLRRLRDRLGLRPVEQPEIAFASRGGALDEPERAEEAPRKRLPQTGKFITARCVEAP